MKQEKSRMIPGLLGKKYVHGIVKDFILPMLSLTLQGMSRDTSLGIFDTQKTIKITRVDEFM